MNRALVVLAFALACGRTSPADPCAARVGLLCRDLDDARAAAQAQFDAAVTAHNSDDDVRAQGTCVQSLVIEQVERKCLADDRCVDLCALHPCPVQGNELCRARCDDVVRASEIENAALDAAIIRAAEQPTLCTCTVCDAVTAPLCADLWACAATDR